MFKFLAIFALIFASQSASAAEESIVGTYRLISSQRLIAETGEREDSHDKTPPASSRMDATDESLGSSFSQMQQAESLDKLNHQQRAELFKTMLAYAGT